MIDTYTLLSGCAWLFMVMMIWFRSEAFLEYLELLGLDMAFGVKDYRSQQKDNPNLTYLDFLIINHNSFFVRLITCPLCFCIWGAILIGAYAGWPYVPFSFFITFGLFGVINSYTRW